MRMSGRRSSGPGHRRRGIRCSRWSIPIPGRHSLRVISGIELQATEGWRECAGDVELICGQEIALGMGGQFFLIFLSSIWYFVSN